MNTLGNLGSPIVMYIHISVSDKIYTQINIMKKGPKSLTFWLFILISKLLLLLLLLKTKIKEKISLEYFSIYNDYKFPHIQSYYERLMLISNTEI